MPGRAVPRVDVTDTPFLTIDPAGSLDLDQALHIVWSGAGWRVSYAIADLPAFVVPGAVGVQEGGLIVLCALFGVPANAALALSLIKRAADLAVGIPGLIGWHALETRRMAHKHRSA